MRHRRGAVARVSHHVQIDGRERQSECEGVEHDDDRQAPTDGVSGRQPSHHATEDRRALDRSRPAASRLTSESLWSAGRTLFACYLETPGKQLGDCCRQGSVFVTRLSPPAVLVCHRLTMANITFVIGGARSGKSSYASRLALSACDAPVYVLDAPLQPSVD